MTAQSQKKIKTAVLGASGYTGADVVRLGAEHPNIEFVALTANAHAGKPMAQVFPHLRSLNLPDLTKIDRLIDSRWHGIDAVFCGLPHGTTQEITKNIREVAPHVKIIDLSADFRLRDLETYAQWYGHDHLAPEFQPDAVYGLSEIYRDQIKNASLIACPGCYPTATLLSLIPPLQEGAIQKEDIIIDAKSGVSGAGRGLKENTLFCEAGEGAGPYAVGSHRHAPEIEQELSAKSSGNVIVNFTPHLVPMSRGELVTCHVKLAEGKSVADIRASLEKQYQNDDFIQILPQGVAPRTQEVRGSNLCLISIFEDRIPGRAIIIGAIDNLVKGSSGQALQNFNIAFGFEETLGLRQLPMFP